MAELPTGTVTFLFTDLESSTRLWQEHPEGMRPASVRHDEVVRAAIESHRGYVVKKTGDGFHAAFAQADDAIEAAVAAQLVLAAEPWDQLDALRVRMGIHSGSAQVRDGDYDGMAVNKAARLMSIAHGGQIVVSRATEELVQDADVELIDLGEHRLRDLTRPERVFQVAHPNLTRAFPPLSSREAFAGNLPVQVTSFVGRDEDVANVVAALEDSLLVTLTGTGGVGKTRLAIHVAGEVLPQMADGAWFCELAAVDDGDTMAQAIAATLGCQQRPNLSLAESIVAYVKARELLLVLDNCEHILDEAGEFADAVVRSCPDVRVMATSREALDLAGERVVRVRSLAAPAPSARGNELVESAAVRLFADRAVDAGAEIVWDDRHWVAVGEICRRVDGIPLAVELAAARTTAMSPTDVAAHLDERFRLLTGKRRGRVERHQTLRATVEWSYQLLSDDDRIVFDRLGVFAGTFDVSAAVAVAAGDELDEWQVTDALTSLVAKSMLVPEPGPDGSSRYGMLETLRQFARERLDGVGDTDARRRASAAYYVTRARDISHGVVGAEHILWVRRLRADLDNIRAAVGWALERDDSDEQQLAVQILARLDETWRGNPDTSLGALAVQAVSAADRSPPELRVPLLTLAAFYSWNQGETEYARRLVDDAMREGIVGGTRNPLAPHGGAVVFEMASGNHARALKIVNDTRAQLASVDNAYAQSAFLGSIASFEGMAGQYEQARADAERALELARQIGNEALVAGALMGKAWALHRDDPAAALAAAQENLTLFRESGISTGSTSAVFALAGGLRARLGDDPGALEYIGEAVVLARDQGLRPQLVAALDYAITPLTRTGRPDVAATLLGALTAGSLVDDGSFPGVEAARARNLDRLHNLLGEETAAHVDRGAAMSYDELLEYAACQLSPG